MMIELSNCGRSEAAPPLVLFCHPSKQGTIYDIVACSRRAGVRTLFLNGFYYKKNALPYSLFSFAPRHIRERLTATLEKARSHPDIDPDEVISLTGPWLELATRPELIFGRSSWLKFGHGIVLADIVFDKIAASYIRRFKQPANTAVLVNGFMNSCLATLRAARERGFQTVLDITLPLRAHEIVNQERMRLGLRPQKITCEQRQRAEISLADHIFVHSKFSLESIRELGRSEDTIYDVGFGSNPKRFRPDPQKKRKDKIQALFVGQLCIRKGVHLLLEAWHSLKLSNAELVLVGATTDPDIVPFLERYRGCYRPAGYISNEQLEHLYQESHFLIFPSMAEGGSNVVNEALAAGLPAIVTPSACSIVDDGSNGFVVPLGDVDTLRSAIMRLIDDRKLREAFSEEARAKAIGRDWDDFGRRRHSAYLKITQCSTLSRDPT